MPIPTHGPVEGGLAFERAVALSQSTEYQEVRRALYDWEDDVVAQRWPVDAAVRMLKERMIAHDGLVESKFSSTTKRITFRIVGIAGGAAAGMAAAGALGAMVAPLAVEVARALAAEGAEKMIELGTAVMPQFRRIEHAKTDPGAALSLAIGALYP